MIEEFREMKKLIILGKLAPLCAYCGKKITNPSDLTQDHVIPKSQHGGTVPENLVPCCKKCNSEKGSLSAKEYYALINFRKGILHY